MGGLPFTRDIALRVNHPLFVKISIFSRKIEIEQYKFKCINKIMEVLINGDYGGFSFSSATIALFKKRTGRSVEEYINGREFRSDPVMIQVYKDLGAAENPVLRLYTIRPGYEQC